MLLDRREFALFVSGALLVACGEAKAPKKKEPEPSWTDLFVATPDIYVVMRPQALKKDQVYGNFWKALVRAAEARGIARGTTMLEAVSGAKQIIIGVNSSDATVVLEGVPASIDPTSVQDAQGHPLFKAPNDTRPKVLAYAVTDAQLANQAALFVLPDRTWVGTIGGARDRARQAFASPTGTPEPSVSSTALLSLRLQGQFLSLFQRNPTVAPLYKKLETVTIELQPGSGGVVVALAYSEADATAYGEMQAKKIANDLSNDKDRKWLKDAKVQYEGNVVYVHVDVPARLLEELPNVRGADLGL